MADSIDVAAIQSAVNEAARQLSRLASSFTGGAASVGTAAGNLGNSVKNVGAGMVRLRNDLDRNRLSTAQATAQLQGLSDELNELESQFGRSAASDRIRTQQLSMATEIAANEIKNQAGGMAKAGLVAAFEYYKNQVLTAARSIQSNAGGMQAAFDLQNQALTDQIAILNRLSGAAESATAVFAAIPSPLSRLAAGVTATAGFFAGLGAAALGLEKEGLEVIQKEMVKTAESFKIVTAAGALFANGMGDVRANAKDAGLDVVEFGKIVAQNGDTISLLGGTVAEGTKKFVAVSKALDSSRIGLFKLGFTAEQQAQATIDYMEMLQKTGQNINKSPAELAIGTRDYLVQLRALSAATGEDVKKIQARQKEAAMQAAVNAKLSQGGEAMNAKFRNLVGRFPGYEKAIQQLFTIGEVVDPVMAVMLANNRELDQALRQGVANIENNNIDAEQAYRLQEEFMGRNGRAIRDNALQMQSVTGVAALTTGSLQEYADAASKARLLGTKAAEQGAQSTLDQAKNLAETTDDLTKNIAEADKAFLDAARRFNEDINPLLKQNSEQLTEILIEGNNKLRTALNLLPVTLNQIRGNPATETELQRERIQTIPGSEAAQDALSGGMAAGGISAGPKSGYLQLLHGAEAVVPLPNNRSIPVSLKLDNSQLMTKDLNANFGTVLSGFKQLIDTNIAVLAQRPQTDPAMPTFTTAIESVVDKSTELNTIMAAVKAQIENGTQQQLAAMQQQIDKMDRLVSAVQDNVRYSERIANELG